MCEGADGAVGATAGEAATQGGPLRGWQRAVAACLDRTTCESLLEVLRLVLDDDDASQLFVAVATLLARGQVPEPAVAGLALGRLVAITKPGGGTRGLVVGDALRRLVARTLAQQFAEHFETACNPHQYALSTRAGAEALVHTLQARTQADPSLTVLSVNAAAA